MTKTRIRDISSPCGVPLLSRLRPGWVGKTSSPHKGVVVPDPYFGGQVKMADDAGGDPVRSIPTDRSEKVQIPRSNMVPSSS